MQPDTLARMFWDRVEASSDRPAQQFKQGADWKTITWREVGDVAPADRDTSTRDLLETRDGP